MLDYVALHTSKRMHFIEERLVGSCCELTSSLHTSKRMHFIEDSSAVCRSIFKGTCIRQNVCTSLRIRTRVRYRYRCRSCIRQNVCTSLRRRKPARLTRTCYPCIRQNVCTSLRIRPACRIRQRPLHLHTSKRMHFIEECSS